MATQRPAVIRTAAVFLAIVVLAGCRSIGVRGSGPPFEVDHEIGDVQEVVVRGSGELHIRNGAESRLVVLAQEEIHRHLTIRTVGDRLIIEPERGYQLRPSAALRYLLTTDVISLIEVGGAVDVTAQSYRTESLRIDTSGSTDLDMEIRAGSVTIAASGSFDGRLSGEATYLTLDFSGSADLDAYDLTARHVDVDTSGSADIYVTAIESLDVSARGSSEVTYRGNPRVDHSSAGASSVTPAD